MFESITRKPFWVNLLIALGLLIFAIVVFFLTLSSLTRHGEGVHVPAVIGMPVNQAVKTLQNQGFEVVVQDSVYVDSIPKLSILNQTPESDANVKPGRTIYLTVNRSVAPLIEMPDLRGFSYLSAKLYLQSLGLRLGEVTYIPDIAKDAVKDQLLNGESIKPGVKINMGTTIDFVLGSGVGGAEIEVPNLVGMTLGNVRTTLSNYSISLGVVVPEGSITDSSAAFVNKQSPAPYTTMPDGSQVANKIRAGELIDIWISAQMPVVKDSIK